MKSVVVLIYAVSLLGCGDYQDSYGSTNAAQSTGTLSFATVGAMVFQPNHCLECHASASASNQQVDLSTYAAVLPLLQKIQTAVTSGHMPQGGPQVPATDQAILLAWISNGAPLTSNIPLPGPTGAAKNKE